MMPPTSQVPDIEMDMLDFMETMKQDVPLSPQWAGDDVVDLRLDLIEEEYSEVLDAVVARNLTETAKELIDLAYVTIGTVLALGMPFSELWNEVHRSNMDKANGPVRPDGKRLKPEGWQPPNIQRILVEAATRAEVPDEG